MVCSAAEFEGLHQAGRTWSRRNWSREVVFAPEDYYQPKHTGSKRDGHASLVRAVADATAADQEIHPIGSGWAFEDLAASDGAMISLAKLDRQLAYVVVALLYGSAIDEWREGRLTLSGTSTR